MIFNKAPVKNEDTCLKTNEISIAENFAQSRYFDQSKRENIGQKFVTAILAMFTLAALLLLVSGQVAQGGLLAALTLLF